MLLYKVYAEELSKDAQDIFSEGLTMGFVKQRQLVL